MKILNFLAAALLGGALLASCGSSKSTTGVVSDEKKIELDECIVLADGNPNRAWGEATNGRLSYAKTYAEGQARAALQRKISALITTASKECGVDYTKSSYTGTEGALVSDQDASGNVQASQIAEDVLTNTPVIKTSIYQKPNGLYHVYVCVEQQESSSALSSKISNKVKQQVSDEDRLKMKYEFEKFEEYIQQQLQKRDDALYNQ